MFLSKSDQNFLNQLSTLSNEEQEVTTQLRINRLRKIMKALEQTKETNGKRQRKSQRISKIFKVKLAAKDSIRIAGLTGTLGSNLLRLSNEITLNCAKSKCASYFCKNGIIDMSDDSKENIQLKLLGHHVMNFLKRKYKYASEAANDPNIEALDKKLNTIKNTNTARKIYNVVDDYKPKSNQERAVKNIYRHILDQHAFRQHMFSEDSLNKYSEQSFIVKFWGYIFESYFGRRNHVLLQWGDTISNSCKVSNLEFRLDLRIILTAGNQSLELCNGELAKKTAINESKYYSDKLKAILVAKQHLNEVIKATKFLPTNTVHNISVPVLQIMGMNCHLYTISMIDKGIYALHKIFTMSYPITNHEIRRGSIQKIVRGFSLIESIIQNTLDIHEEYSRATDDSIVKAIGKKKGTKANAEDWISCVISEQENEEEQKDDSEQDDSEQEEEESQDNDDDQSDSHESEIAGDEDEVASEENEDTK
jgi:hypothetical protein